MAKPRHTNQPFTLILLSVSTGIVSDYYFRVPFWISFGTVWTVVLIFLLVLLLKKVLIGNFILLLMNLLLLVGFVGTGASWHHLYKRVFSAREVGLYVKDAASPVMIRGYVVSRPEICISHRSNEFDIPAEADRTQFQLRASHLLRNSQWITVCGKINVSIEGEHNRLLVGDRIEVAGELSRPRQSRSETDFSPRKFYRSQRILTVLFVRCPENIRKTGITVHSLFVIRSLQQLADSCGVVIDRYYSPDSSSLVRAMLLGERQRVPPALREQFLVTGTVHLLAISGLHVGILSAGWLWLMRLAGWPRAQTYWLTAILVTVFCLMVGAKPPVFRATVLVVVYCLAKIMGRQPVSVNSLCLAGLFVILFNPASLFQTGPQLSFIAVATLIMIGDQFGRDHFSSDPLRLFILRKRTTIERVHDRCWSAVKMSLVGCLGIWVATLPLVAEHFHVIAPVGILVNVVLMIPVALFLNSCFLAVLFGAMNLGQPFALASEWLLQLIHQILNWASQMPGGHWWSFGLGGEWLAVFYLLFAIMFLYARFWIRLKWQLLIAVLWLATALSLSHWNQLSSGKLRITFVDVGHGASALIEFPNGKAVLYDAGSLNSSQAAFQRIAAVLWQRKIGTLDTVIISHADLDHFNAVPAVLNRFQVNRILLSPMMKLQSQGKSMDKLRMELARHQISVYGIDTAWNVEFDPRCTTRILHPSPGFCGRTDNSNSLVIDIEYQGRSILLTGDLEGDGMAELLNHPPRNVDILMCPHHGSGRTNHANIADWTQPRHVVISSSSRRIGRGVVETYRSRGAKVHTTGQSGAVTFEIAEGRVSVREFLRDEGDHVGGY